MKRQLFIILGFLTTLFAVTTVASAQTNVQVHYNFGKHIYKDLATSTKPAFMTLEHYSGDKWGDTFFFTDLIFDENNIGQAYFEIFRNLKFWDAPISLHIEYNGGLDQDFSINHAYLGGLSYSYFNPKNQLVLGLTVAYRHDQKQPRPHNFQTTGNWSWTSWNRLFTFAGFFDFYTKSNDEAKSRVGVIAEPQLWINLNQFVGVHDDFNLSLGTEVKLYYNFDQLDKFHALPTLGLKWTFK